jgi:rSAM/selenodomain-associated transferase 2
VARLGVVIPSLNEGDNLPGILRDLSQLDVAVDVVVVDGGSVDDTVAVAQRHGARVIETPPGRGAQLRAGAGVLGCDWLCFVHADVRMPERARAALERAVSEGDVSAAVWRLAIDRPGWWFRVIEFGGMLRDRLGGLPYGDQGLLVRRELYDAVGGYPDLPIMEDVAIVRALGRLGRVRRFRAPLLVSSRRWVREGPYRTWFRNVALLSAYLAGVSPQRLVKWYRPEPR